MKSNFDIYERIFEFVIEVITFLDTLPKTETNKICINQCIRSVTSMGANGEEADGSSSKKEFIHCFTIVRKEGKETVFWLKVIAKTNNSTFSPKVKELIKEGEEIVAIVSSIIKKTTNNLK